MRVGCTVSLASFDFRIDLVPTVETNHVRRVPKPTFMSEPLIASTENISMRIGMSCSRIDRRHGAWSICGFGLSSN